jgi:tetratricopeptide (TPR) repeat protein
MYEKAIELDPDGPDAYLGLASLHIRIVRVGLSDSRANPLKQISELTRKALMLAGPSSMSHRALGFVCLHKQQFGQARRHFERALALSPNDASMLADIANLSCYFGRAKEAIELLKKAMRLNPNYPDWYPWSLALAFFTARQYDEALKVLEETHSPLARRLLAATYAQAGRLEQARAAAKEYLEVIPDFSIKRYMGLEPYEDPADLEDYVQGLRKAGLPE